MLAGNLMGENEKKKKTFDEKSPEKGGKIQG